MTLERDRSVAWVRLLANAKLSSITVAYCGENTIGRGLWQVRNSKGEYLALPSVEEQVVESVGGS